MSRPQGTFSVLLANRWAFVPVAVLGSAVLSAVAVVTLAVNDRGATAAEPDYYRKGASWDDWKRQLAENGALRWVLTPEIVPGSAGSGFARLEMAVADKNAVPIEGAQVHVEVIPIKDADSRVEVALPESAAGRYGADVPLRVGGVWEIRSTVEWKGKRYCDRVRRNVAFARPAEPMGGGRVP